MSKVSVGSLVDTWKDCPSIRQCFKMLKMRSKTKTLSESTLNAYEIWIPRLISFTKMSPDELIAEGLKDSELAEERISDFYSAHATKKITYSHPISLNSLNTSVYGTIRGFYTKNKVNTTLWITPQTTVPDVDRIDSEYPLFVKNPKTMKLDLNRPLLDKFISKLNARDSTIALCLMSSGLDVSDILGLSIDDVVHQKDEERIFLNINRLKTGEIAKSFLSREATIKIRKYIETFRKDAPNEEMVFINVVESNEYLVGINHSDPILVASIDYNFRRTCRVLGIRVRTGKQSPMRPKRLRKCFKSGCTRAGLDLDTIRVFMGQKSAVSKVYLGKSREELEMYYEQAEPFLTLVRDEEREDELDSLRIENQELRKENKQKELRLRRLEEKVFNDNFSLTEPTHKKSVIDKNL